MKTNKLFVRATLAAVVSLATHAASAVDTTEVFDHSGGSTSPTYDSSLAALAFEPANTGGLTAGDVSDETGVHHRDFGTYNRDFRINNRDFRAHNRDFRINNRDFRAHNRDFRINNRDFRAHNRDFRMHNRDFGQ